MTFASREHAGRELGRHLKKRGLHPDVVLGLPRGGVVVAAEVARELTAPLELLVVRKIGHPAQREYAVGAVAEPGVLLLDRDAMVETHVRREDLDPIIQEETQRLREYQESFHRSGAPELRSKRVLIVDDGLATGLTVEAAAVSAQQQGASSIFVAVPVASVSAVDRLAPRVTQVIALVIDPAFMAVGRYYRSFPQTTDEEVRNLLPAHA